MGYDLDVCAQDGIWFDQNELERVQGFHESWEAKKDDIKEEFRGTFKKIENDYWKSYDHWRDQLRDKIYVRHFLFYWMDQLAHGSEKKKR